ncbi:hypothetical protein K8F61_09505 [Microbacterium resistens]|uniref:Lipoprotein n=1 Tax=Microbacterium resistens TaxID=156977 RepID=A0ABY3RWB7_9MICO|nr:hypothetical protein [Microbacterium resistens]UGS28363.1 hypothetical protein K8F61_09505 [Microbacterium resistens]
MRISKIMAGTALLAALALAGCSTAAPGEGETSKPTETAAEKPAETQKPTAEGDDPFGECVTLKPGDVIESPQFINCTMEQLRASAGYAVKETSDSTVSTMKVNPSDKAYLLEDSIGSVIAIGDTYWVKPVDGEWSEGPSDTSGSGAFLSALGANIGSHDPLFTIVNSTGTLTVKGTQEVQGQEALVLTGTFEQMGEAGEASGEVTLQMTSGYVVLGATTVSGEVTTTLEVTEWNKKQDIQAPM